MASPRTWNKTISVTDVASTAAIPGASATPFGPSTIYAYNSDATNAVYITITFVGANTTATVATATDDGVSWLIPAGKEHAFNLNSQNSTDKYSISAICASGKTATLILCAIQAM